MNNIKNTFLEAKKCLRKGEKFITKLTGEDPTTQSMSWDVEYVPDFPKSIKNLTDIINDLTSLHKKKPNDKLFELIEMAKSLRNRLSRLANKYVNLKEISSTGTGASFTPGKGPQYASIKAYTKNTNPEGTKNIYYYKLGWKKVPKTIKKSGLEIKKLF